MRTEIMILLLASNYLTSKVSFLSSKFIRGITEWSFYAMQLTVTT